MQKYFDVRFPQESDYEKLKLLWKTSFDDSDEVLDFFFGNTISPDRILAAFDGSVPVSALYMLESEIVINEKRYSTYYIYAVCTHPDYRKKGLMNELFKALFKVAESRGVGYLFLVPEEKYLFEVYKKLGFKKGFCYGERTVLKDDFEAVISPEVKKLSYTAYNEYAFRYPKNVPFVVLEESTFKSFYSSVSGDVAVLSVEGEGYVLFENLSEKTIVYELYGNENVLLKAVFDRIDKDSLVYRCIDLNENIPYGMYYKTGNVPEIENGFFGIPYST